jgi:ABC-type lipoprotein export system ATPase subunit
MVTHDPQAASYADQVIHLDKGKLGRIEDNRPAAKGN